MDSYNTRIAVRDDATQHKRAVGWWNIANAARDDEKCSLISRLPLIIADIKKLNLDVLILGEAGRSSTDSDGVKVSFTEMAARIEKETGMLYLGVDRLNASGLMAFGKACFYNPETVFVNSLEQRWTSSTSDFPSGPYFGNAVSVYRYWPVVDKRVVESQTVVVAAAHLPMGLQDRLNVCQWLVRDLGHVDVLLGDFNTFPDDGGPEMLQILKTAYRSHLPDDTPYTFRGFPHDILSIDTEKLHLMPHATVLVPGDIKTTIIPVAWLDHCFSTGLDCVADVIPMNEDTPSSDHCLIRAHISVPM